jgi:hypothetical protein
MEAAQPGLLAVVRLLVEAAADVNVWCLGDTRSAGFHNLCFHL